MHTLTDEEIARRVQNGETEFFGVLVERYESKLMRYARKFLIHKQSGAKDLVQNVFMKVYVNLKGFNPKRRFSPWIYRIAHNEFINAIHKKKRDSLSLFQADILFPHPIAKETADRDAEENEMREMLENQLEALDSKYREPLVLFFFEEMDYREIAEVLRIPVSTVGVRLARGKKALKKIYEEQIAEQYGTNKR